MHWWCTLCLNWVIVMWCDPWHDGFFFISNRPIFKSQIQTDVKNELLNWICFGCFPCICRVGVLIILTMQSGRKWAKRWWWWQAPTSLPPALLTSPPTHCYSEHLISFFYLYMYTNWKLPFCSVYTSSFKTAVYFATTRQYIQLLKAIAFNTLTHLLVQVTCTWFRYLCALAVLAVSLGERLRLNTAWYCCLSYTPTHPAPPPSPIPVIASCRLRGCTISLLNGSRSIKNCSYWHFGNRLIYPVLLKKFPSFHEMQLQLADDTLCAIKISICFYHHHI